MLVKRLLTVAFVGLTLGACSSTPDVPEWDGVSCPDIGAVRVASEYVNENEFTHSNIVKVRGACLVEDGVIDLDLRIDTDTQNLGGVAETEITLQVFTAILDMQQEPLSKDVHTIEVVLPPAGKVFKQTHTINVRYKMNSQDKNPNNYHFVAGFQLGE